MTARIATLIAFIPTAAFAHPGHGHTDSQSWAHYLTEPVHVAVIAGAATLALVAAVAWRRSRRDASRRSRSS